MFETLIKYFQGSPLALWGPFGVLILCGLGLPLPEDIVLISAGALGQIDGRSWLSVSAVMYAGVMIGDSTIFLTGRYLGQRLLATHWFQRYLSPAKQERVEVYFHRFGSMVLFVARFLPGLRAPVFFTAGSMKVRYWKFLFFDGLAALISVPFFVWLGHWLWAEFHDDLEELDRVLARSQSYTLLVSGTLVAIVIVAIVVRIRRKRASHE
jgi:membrane protein DedA with SNARE-associated domain